MRTNNAEIVVELIMEIKKVGQSMKIQIQQNVEIKLVSRLLFGQKSSFLKDFCFFSGLGPSLNVEILLILYFH